MEKKNKLYKERVAISLKHLPPIVPSLITEPISQFNYEKPNFGIVPDVVKPSPEKGIKVVESDKESTGEDLAYDKNLCEDFSLYSTKHIDPNSTNRINSNDQNYETCKDAACLMTESSIEEVPKRKSAKSQLHDVCAAKNWKSPVFECYKEEGPCHMKLFTFKVVIEIAEASTTILESFSAPQSKKKRAAQHAAEGAVWYLSHLGHFPINK